ncbi:MAG TPA: hypothetical protein DDW50_14330 [Firmicutes bacterium]|jgi:hypothetical protein|nr:hypothetical protein [Bacillota bacterium]
MIKYHAVIQKLTSKVENDSETRKQLPVGVDILLDRIKEKGFVVHVQELEFNNIDIQLMNQEDCQKRGLSFEHSVD